MSRAEGFYFNLPGVVDALKDHHGSRILGDSRRIKVIQKSDQDWVNQDWFPASWRPD